MRYPTMKLPPMKLHIQVKVKYLKPLEYLLPEGYFHNQMVRSENGIETVAIISFFKTEGKSCQRLPNSKIEITAEDISKRSEETKQRMKEHFHKMVADVRDNSAERL